ncbi:uncharacterized protein LOC124873283 isoform X1 [Girardinichthys multiradiatus]|uniref:uncharacterized protein LOC124873283 isoform X1 n=1 Tax=Girardinichthys multiradiatus TaxID=208333 RepID=UPI001FAC9C2F|nr:uncharacterized protein LOC124873283 isoform X1 [Girardinichthys multiradiatus]
MNIHPSLVCFFFFSLQVSSANSLKHIYGAAGEDIRVTCGIFLFDNWKIFCMENCSGGNLLISTSENKAKIGRYSIEFVRDTPLGFFLFYVSISELIQSDSGGYRCGLGASLSSALYQDFRLVVKDVHPSLSTPPTRGCLSSSSGSFTASASSETTDLPVLTKTNTTTSKGAPNHTGSANVLRYVALTLVIIIILLSVALLVCCRKRPEKHHTENTPATENSRMNKDGTEEYQEWKSANVEIYSSYRETTNTKPTEAETNQSCSSVTATTSQHQAEDDSTKVIYAKVKFSNRKVVSPPRASCSTINDVIYAEPRVDKTSHNELVYSNTT